LRVQFRGHIKLVKQRVKWLTWEVYKTEIVPQLRRKQRAMSADSQLFEEAFTITTVDHAKYDRVGRFGATSADAATVMTLDINTELFPCAIGETLHCVLASSLSLDGTKDDGKGWRDINQGPVGGVPTLADMFDYVCHGKIYKFEDGADDNTM
jgi:DNA-directed RNA polymerase I, II, and III subunit RPABC3